MFNPPNKLHLLKVGLSKTMHLNVMTIYNLTLKYTATVKLFQKKNTYQNFYVGGLKLLLFFSVLAVTRSFFSNAAFGVILVSILLCPRFNDGTQSGFPFSYSAAGCPVKKNKQVFVTR